jgi:hypothetical protein
MTLAPSEAVEGRQMVKGLINEQVHAIAALGIIMSHLKGRTPAYHWRSSSINVVKTDTSTMTPPNLLNVYSGPDALQKYFDPHLHPPLPLVEIPRTLNPYYADGVRIFAKMMSTHPANNVKIIPGNH